MKSKFRKIQHQSPENRTWNIKGDSDFAVFTGGSSLAGDNWRCIADEQIVNNEVGNITVYKGDFVIAMVDNPGNLNYENLNNGNWDIIRRAPIGFGTKKTGKDGGRLFEASIDNDYYYLCVVAGDPENEPQGLPGTAVWKKIALTTT